MHKVQAGWYQSEEFWGSEQGHALLESEPQVLRDVLASAIEWQVSKTRARTQSEDDVNTAVISRLLSRKLPLTREDASNLLHWSQQNRFGQAESYIIASVDRYIKEHGADHELRQALADFRGRLGKRYSSLTKAQERNLRSKIAEMLGEQADMQIHLDKDEPWASRLIADIAQLDDTLRDPMKQLFAHVVVTSGSKPSDKWQKQATKLLESVDLEQVLSCLKRWIACFGTPRDVAPTGGYHTRSVWDVAEINADAMKGLIWLASHVADKDVIRAVATAGLSGQKKIPGVGPRSLKVTNAAVWALSQIDDELAIGQLAILRAKIKNKSTQKQIDKAMDAIAERIGVAPEEVEEMSVPTYGLTEVGRTRETLGNFIAELVVTGTNSTELKWIKPDGKPQKSVPKAVKDDYADELKELKAAAKDIQKMLPAQRDRIDQLNLQQKTWAFDVWKERYLDHPLVGTLARRLIWVFDHGVAGPRVEAAWLDGELVDVNGEAVQYNEASALVSLWHPIGHDEESVVAWRQFFEGRQIKQPFKQAHREVYILTDAERNTNIYSNRHATHVLRQHQFKSLAEQRGWRYALQGAFDSPDEVATRQITGMDLRAEFWVDRPWGEGQDEWNDSGIFFRVVTDQVRFFPTDSVGRDTWHNTGNVAGDAIPLDRIDPLVFSEIMRDVDLFVGVASVGNDPNWQDGGPEGRYRDYWHDYAFGDLGATSKTRKDILQRLIPRLKIADRCSFDDKFLVVRGDKRTYKIHLGSSNILMQPNDQYLCIVPGRGDAKIGDKVFLPFEGDQRLAVILSKAMMLAEDTKIKDPTILSQIER
jgi:hypothetical protein